MSKPSRGKTHAPAPSASQMAAVRRVAAAGDLAQARQRLAALRKSFPSFKPLLGLAWEIEDLCGTSIQAAARAYAWHVAVPGSHTALAALCASARDAGMAAVYASALHRLQILDGNDAPPPIAAIDGPLGVLSLEQAEAIDLSRIYLADDDAAAAVAVLQGVDHPSARNNLALALFITGDMAQARAQVEANWQADRANLFALERVVRWRCWTDGLDRCLGFAATLCHSLPRRAEDAIARVAALRFLDDAEAAGRAWAEAFDAPYWQEATSEQYAMFKALGAPGSELPGDAALWFPGHWMRAITSLARAAPRPGDAQWQQRWDALLDACDAHADYLGRAAELGEDAERSLALAVLKRRTQGGDAASHSTLRGLLKRRCGPDSVRMELLTWLVEQGLQQRQVPIEVLAAGKIRPVRSIGLRLSGEPRPCPYPPAGAALNARLLEATGRGALHEALPMARQLLQMYPDQPSAYTNLAAVKEGLKHPAAEVAKLYRQAYQLAPDYLFARCGHARCLVAQGHIEQAQALLVGLAEREEWHPSEYRSYLLTQRALALAGGEHEAARALEASILDLEYGRLG
jgi:tetratricopeptide (TPR) repeat protein